jgi:hypothetical protein
MEEESMVLNPLAKRFGIVSQVLAVIVVLAMVIPASLALIRAYETTPTSDVTEYVRIDIKNAGDVAFLSTKMDIVATYDSYIVAKATKTVQASLSKGYAVESLPEMTKFKFGQYAFDTTLGSPAFTEELKTYSDVTETNYYFVKFNAPVKAEWKADMEAKGAKIKTTVDGYTVLVNIAPSMVQTLQAEPYVMWVGEYYPAYKISSEVASAVGTIKMDVMTPPEYRGYVASRIGRLFQKLGTGSFDEMASRYETRGGLGFLRINADASLVTSIARIPNVYYIIRFDQQSIDNAFQHGQVQSGASTSIGAPATLVAGAYGAAVPIWNMGIFGQTNPQTGQPIVVGSSDSGVRLDHDMIRQGTITNANWDTSNGYAEGNYNFSVTTHRKIVRYAIGAETQWDKIANTAPDHGAHTTGTVAGYDNPVAGTSANDGVAPGAKISFYDIGNNTATSVYPPADYSVMWNLARIDGARSYTQSWGSAYQTSYTGDMYDIDMFAYTYPTFMYTWSAGNSGTGANTIGQQAESKNTIAVGAYTDGANSMNSATFSSNGPTFDGRLKPDIMAPGTATTSVNSAGTNGYTDMDGTSMAAPNAQGGIALMAQYFLQGWYPTGALVAGNAFDPSSSLIRACLINGCEQMTGATRAYNNGNGNSMAYPNSAQGWGRMDLDNSLMFAADALKMQCFDGDNGVETGKYVEYTYRVAAVGTPLKVTIAWNDYPAAIGSTNALVNDLDLTVTNGANVYKGNVFTGTIGTATTPANSAFAADHKNNVEQVWVAPASAVAGTWVIRVTGYNVPVAPQPFAIVISGNLDLTYGTIQLDHNVYGATETATIRIEDSGAGVGPLTATARSIVAGFTRSVSCTQVGSGVYIGTIALTMDRADLVKLPVDAADTLSVRYDDVSGTVHSSWANASVDGYGPTITNVHTGLVSATSAEIEWTTGDNANATVYYGTTPSTVTSKVVQNTPFALAQKVVLGGLLMNQLYYFDVESTDVHGNKVKATNGGNHYTFSTQGMGDMLLYINGGTGYNYDLMIQKYVYSLNQSGWVTNTMTSWVDGNPTLATLQLYKVILFQPGLEEYPQFSDTQRTLFKQYLDAGGRLFTTSQDTAWAFGDTTSPYYTIARRMWMRSQLHQNWLTDPATFANIYGITGDPISGTYTAGLTYNAFRSGGYGDTISTLAAGHTATYVWANNAAQTARIAVKGVSLLNNGTAGVGVWGGTPTRIVSCAFEWSCIIDNFTVASPVRSAILDSTINWLLGHDHPDVVVTYPNGGEILPGPSVAVTWTRALWGGAVVATQSLFYSPDAGTSWFLETSAIGTTALTYTWNIGTRARGSNYLVKIVVADSGVPVGTCPLSGSDTSNAVFTINTADTVPPLVVPGSVRVTPNPVSTGQTCWINATIDDTTTGNSAISQAEYFIGTPGANGAGTAMSATDGVFNTATEAVYRMGTVAPGVSGTYTVYVHGRDSAGNWGPYESTTFQFFASGPPPTTPWQNITVTAGWNLISVNITGPTTMPAALTDKANGGAGLVVWTRAMWYNPATTTDPWKQYNTGWNAALNDLTTVSNSMGVWLYVTTVGDGQICVGGTGYSLPTTTAITLRTGWNLVGFPSNDAAYTVAMLKAACPTVTIVEHYDAVATYLTSAMLDADVFVPDSAYWVYTSADTTWNKAY